MSWKDFFQIESTLLFNRTHQSLQVITYASSLNEQVCRMIKSAISHKLNVKVLGPNMKPEAKTAAFLREAVTNLEHATRSTPTHFIYVDSDTIFQSVSEEILAAYNDLGARLFTAQTKFVKEFTAKAFRIITSRFLVHEQVST